MVFLRNYFYFKFGRQFSPKRKHFMRYTRLLNNETNADKIHIYLRFMHI